MGQANPTIWKTKRPTYESGVSLFLFRRKLWFRWSVMYSLLWSFY